jgi:replicative DNA helicase
VVEEWRKRRDLPLYFNFTSNMRCSQLKAVVVEAIRRHNVGLVVIDHFKYLDMDGRWRSSIEEDGAKARFLKQDIATQLNVAVVCLAHTAKSIDTQDRRPKMHHLRGSQEIAAHADFVTFVYRPYNNASQSDIDAGNITRTDAELIWAKNRHGLEGSARFHFDASTMTIYTVLLALVLALGALGHVVGGGALA